MKTEELQSKVIQWADERGIFQKATRIKQAFKTLEECGELIEAIGGSDVFKDENATDEFAVAKNYDHSIKDAIGDIAVTIIIQAHMNGWTLDECLEAAYNEIKDRKGSIQNGTYVKNPQNG